MTNIAKGLGQLTLRFATKADYDIYFSIYHKTRQMAPGSHGAYVSPSDGKREAEINVNFTFDHGHPWLIERENGEVIGMSSSWDLVNSSPVKTHSFIRNHPLYSRKAEYAEILKSQYIAQSGFTWENFPKRHTMYIHFTGFLPQYQGYGVFKAIYKPYMQMSAELGYQYSLVISTNKTTRNFGPNSKSKLVGSVKYADLFPDFDGFSESIAEGNDGAYLILDTLRDYTDPTHSKL